MNRRNALAGLMALLASPGANARGRRAIRAPLRLPETVFTDARSQRTVHLVRDVIANRVAVLNFMFVGCSTVCPVQSQLLLRTQKLMAARMGRNVVFVSITLSPMSDTPKKLVEFADRHGAGPNWHFLRTDFQTTNRLRQSMEAYQARDEDHPPVFFIGKAGSPDWARLYGLPRPEQIVSEINGWLA